MYTYAILPNNDSAVVGRALIATLGMYIDESLLLEIDSSDDSADLVIIIENREVFYTTHSHLKDSGKIILFFESRGQHELDGAIVYTNIQDAHCILAMKEVSKRLLALDKTIAVPEMPAFSLPEDLAIIIGRKLRILVIDDTQTHLDAAVVLLVGHTVVTALGFLAGMKILETETFDAVLTDLEMPENAYYSAFSAGRPDVVREYGFLVMTAATLRGIPVAIVTDANHHNNWISAAFDHFRRPMTMNGQRVRWFNNLGKRWDMALAALLENEALET